MGVHRVNKVGAPHSCCGGLGNSRLRFTSRRLHVKLSATFRSEAVGFRGAGGERIRNHGQKWFKVRMTDGHVAESTWQVEDVKRPFLSVAKMVAAPSRLRGSKDRQTEG